MKKIFCFLTIALLAFSCDSRLDKYQRLIPKDDSIPAPMPITIKSIRSIPGGAVIKVIYPDDNNIRGTIAVYERNGETVNTKISRYVDSLVVEGFPDVNDHLVKLYSFNVNEEKSQEVPATIKPLTPPIKTVRPEMTPTFGGVKIFITGNESKADFAVCLLRDEDLADEGKPIKDMKWVEVTTLFTSSNNINLTRRSLAPVEALFAVYIRDHWGNVSDTTMVKLTPIEEYKIDHSRFKDASLDDDNCKSSSPSYPLEGLWDDSGASVAGHFFASDTSPRPCWLTIDFGLKAQLSRIHTLPRIDYMIWSSAHPRVFEFWGWIGEEKPRGTYNALNPHGFQDGWVLLGEFEQIKPSGYEEDGTVGTITAEDRAYFNAGNDFEFDPDKYPHANDAITHLRVVFVDNFSTYGTEAETMSIQFGEVTPYGIQITE